MKPCIKINFRSPVILAALLWAPLALAQPSGLAGRPAAAADAIPDPIVAPIPAIEPLAGPGKVYNSSAALWPGKGVKELNYTIDEYMISGTAAGEPYSTRLVIRR